MSKSTVAIVGSGIVGTTVAYHLVARGVDVALFEKGPDYPYPHATQFQEEVRYLYHRKDYALADDLKNVSTSGYDAQTLNHERRMVVGGSATHWQAVTPRMLPSDFKTKSHFGYGEDWPITYEELEPYYCRAEQHLGVSGTVADNPFAPPRSQPYPLPAFEPSYAGQLVTDRVKRRGLILHSTPQARTREPYDGRPACQNFGVCRVCPIGARYSPNHHLLQALQSKHCTLRTNLSVRRIVMDTSNHARALVIQENDAAAVEEHAADLIVIAAGALESARLLLLSRDERHPDGIGNRAGHVGAHLSFHHLWWAPIEFREPVFGGRLGPVAAHSWQFLDADTRGRHGGVRVALDSWPPDVRGLESTYGLWNPGSGADIVEGLQPMRHTMGIYLDAESVPSPKKYLSLSHMRDRFGDPFAHVHYEANEFDHATHDFGRHLYGRFGHASGAELAPFPPDYNVFNSGAHHMGTCRMSTTEKEGVVDTFGRVHGVSNLFVLGGSMFAGPSGAINPTLTMTALALRATDLILNQLTP